MVTLRVVIEKGLQVTSPDDIISSRLHFYISIFIRSYITIAVHKVGIITKTVGDPIGKSEGNQFFLFLFQVMFFCSIQLFIHFPSVSSFAAVEALFF